MFFTPKAPLTQQQMALLGLIVSACFWNCLITSIFPISGSFLPERHEGKPLAHAGFEPVPLAWRARALSITLLGQKIGRYASKKTFLSVAENAAGYYPGPVPPSTVDGVPFIRTLGFFVIWPKVTAASQFVVKNWISLLPDFILTMKNCSQQKNPFPGCLDPNWVNFLGRVVWIWLKT